MFKPSVNSISQKSGKIVGQNPDYPEIGQMKYKTGNPSRKSTLSIKKPGGR